MKFTTQIGKWKYENALWWLIKWSWTWIHWSLKRKKCTNFEFFYFLPLYTFWSFVCFFFSIDRIGLKKKLNKKIFFHHKLINNAPLRRLKPYFNFSLAKFIASIFVHINNCKLIVRYERRWKISVKQKAGCCINVKVTYNIFRISKHKNSF